MFDSPADQDKLELPFEALWANDLTDPFFDTFFNVVVRARVVWDSIVAVLLCLSFAGSDIRNENKFSSESEIAEAENFFQVLLSPPVHT